MVNILSQLKIYTECVIDYIYGRYVMYSINGIYYVYGIHIIYSDYIMLVFWVSVTKNSASIVREVPLKRNKAHIDSKQCVSVILLPES